MTRRALTASYNSHGCDPPLVPQTATPPPNPPVRQGIVRAEQTNETSVPTPQLLTKRLIEASFNVIESRHLDPSNERTLHASSTPTRPHASKFYLVGAMAAVEPETWFSYTLPSRLAKKLRTRLTKRPSPPYEASNTTRGYMADIRSELRDVSGANQVYRINNSATVGGEDRSLRKLKAYQRPVQCEKVSHANEIRPKHLPKPGPRVREVQLKKTAAHRRACGTPSKDRAGSPRGVYLYDPCLSRSVNQMVQQGPGMPPGSTDGLPKHPQPYQGMLAHTKIRSRVPPTG
ncbi:hypothetical protein FA13DRAFT_1714919 [Coprinellus micaceus]|uniref:Uncharacterized protein n=1 Tax=Coprinellus micaceus TaxID=71717 RepID=A0A4Y7SQ50_COPMI|nr:hypothetical protein FA13DRAFT_1714919 [Coprinellus micaceus]